MYTNVPLVGVFPQRVRAKERRDRMGTTGQMLITAGAVLSAGILLLTTYNPVSYTHLNVEQMKPFL